MKCRFCENKVFYEFLDLINSPPANSFLIRAQIDKPEVFFPLKLFVCEKCFLVQIDEYKKSKDIFSDNYVYFSSYSKSWLEHAKNYTEKMVEKFNLSRKNLVIEIASNDGYLLQYFKGRGIPCLGIEPAANTAKSAKEKGITVIEDFFSSKLAQKLTRQGKKADLLVGNNVLAHVPEINDFVKGVKIILNRRGVITMEFPHLMQLIENNQFDTIYHEHFSYLSFLTVKKIFEKHGLEIFDVEELTTHGGSLRIYVRHKNEEFLEITKNVKNLIRKEINAGMDKLPYYQGFQAKADKVKMDFIEFLIKAKKDGKKIAGYGAAAKGNTFLNYCGIKKDLVSFVVDASPYKQNRYLPGSHIFVTKEKEILKFKPDFVIILPWNIKEEVMGQLNYIRGWGGKFVTAIPILKIF